MKTFALGVMVGMLIPLTVLQAMLLLRVNGKKRKKREATIPLLRRQVAPGG